MASEHIVLVGGPGDGEEYDLTGKGDLICWEPATDRDKVALRMHSRIPSQLDRVLYRRSLRTRTQFLYQP